MEANNVQSSASSGNVRSKTDPAWEHFTLSTNDKGAKMLLGVLVLDIKLLLIMTCELIYCGIARNNVSCLSIATEASGLTVDAQLWMMDGLIKGISFVKSVDASDILKDATNLYDLFMEIIKWAGPDNVVHLVTDNASDYVVAGRLIHEKYYHIYWSPSAAHYLNLILKDIDKRDHVAELVSRASKMTTFVYNHIYILSWLRKISGWKEIVHLGVTHFATTFITLKSIYDHKHDLQALVTVKYYTSHKLSKSLAGKTVTSIILDAKFWEECLFMMKIAAPIIRLLSVVDADEKPLLGYVYEGMIRIQKAIMSIFRNKSTMYGPYIKIINDRWDKHFGRNLYAAAYFLNPTFLYDKEAFSKTPEVLQGLLGLLENISICSNSAKAMREIKFYRDRLESFSHESAFSSANKRQQIFNTSLYKFILDEWWRLLGYSVPQLQKVAIRLLSQTTSSLGCERNWSVFERIHTKKINRLEHQRLSDLIFVNYNLHRHQYKKRSYDPIDYDCIDKTNFWIVEEEEEAELVDGDMVEAIYGEDAIPTLDESHNQDDVDMNEEEVNFELFGNAIYEDAFDQQEYLGHRDVNESWPQHQP
ncbi:uncharacterized protein LOC120282732 [Dioscorea cayenensis subsp. rotundata]|uniref:Uncharacterized protein LOC120282732 n=1 Tax=Dioscorea cayennensis subsp. rotundata TaxID=55577 RepID=A0AB40D5J2_DIOCR|nr:uncharacterized protein LOC120282732 [Dioscorea cayenensis subsp. rotundata]